MSDLENQDLESQAATPATPATSKKRSKKQEKMAAEQEQEQVTAVDTEVDGTVDAPFLSDEEAAASEVEPEEDDNEIDESSPFAEIIARAKEAEAEKKAKKPKKSSSKKKTGLDLTKVADKLETKDPSEVPLRWYVLQAFSGFEQRVVQALTERISLYHMEDYFGQILVPKERVKDHDKEGKRRESERKFFPGYVLVEMKMTSDSWQLVKHTERVLGFIGGSPERPLPITTAEADKILDRLKETVDTPRPKTMFEVGETVRATEGAFKDFSGVVEKVDYEKSRLTVSIAIFGRSTPVDLEFNQVEKEN